jgi:vancomycin resistance protein YoaR
LKEISKEGGPRAGQRSNGKAAQVVRRKPRKKGYARRSYARRRGAAFVALGACLLLVVFFAVDFLAGGGDEISRGVSIGSVDVGGMTKDEAGKAVQGDASATFQKISFGSGEDEFSLSGEDLGVQVNAASAVDRAYAVGRRGGAFQHLSDGLRSFMGGVHVNLVAGYDKAEAKKALAKAADGYDQKPQNASFSVTDKGKVEVKEAKNGRVLDQDATLANLEGSLQNMSGHVPIVQGKPPKPEVTTAEVQSYKPEEVIGKYQTDFLWDSNPNRQYNMKLAASAVNNTVLAPGEVFSFNKLTKSLQYKEAKTYSNGGIGVANGGGLCQVSSTVYMAANYAGLEIVERHPHYAVLPYIKPGFDATVWFGENGWGALDMKFKNTTDGYIVIREWVDDKGILNAQILGKDTGKKVEMSTKKIYEDPVKGIKWTTYKKVTEDGKVTRDGVLYSYRYSFNPPVPADAPHYKTTAPRVGGWPDPTNTTGWASPH